MTDFNSSMTEREFLDWLRAAAIKGNMPPQFIDRVDDIVAAKDAEDEVELLRNIVDGLAGSLSEVVEKARDGTPTSDPAAWDDVLSAAELLLKEHDA